MLDAILNWSTDELVENVSSDSNLTTAVQQDEVSMKSAQVTDEMEAIFITSLYASLGAPLEGDSRLVFDEFVKKISGFIKVNDTPQKRATFSKFDRFVLA